MVFVAFPLRINSDPLLRTKLPTQKTSSMRLRIDMPQNRPTVPPALRVNDNMFLRCKQVQNDFTESRETLGEGRPLGLPHHLDLLGGQFKPCDNHVLHLFPVKVSRWFKCFKIRLVERKLTRSSCGQLGLENQMSQPLLADAAGRTREVHFRWNAHPGAPRRSDHCTLPLHQGDMGLWMLNR